MPSTSNKRQPAPGLAGRVLEVSPSCGVGHRSPGDVAGMVQGVHRKCRYRLPEGWALLRRIGDRSGSFHRGSGGWGTVVPMSGGSLRTTEGRFTEFINRIRSHHERRSHRERNSGGTHQRREPRIAGRDGGGSWGLRFGTEPGSLAGCSFLVDQIGSPGDQLLRLSDLVSVGT